MEDVLDRRPPASIYGLAASVSDQKLLVTLARTGILETGGGGPVALIAAVAPAALRLRNSSGTITHGDGSTSFHAGFCPAHGDKLRDEKCG